MSIVRYNSLPIAEQRKREVQDAKLSLVEEHTSIDEAIQTEIRKKYSLSQEVSLLRKEVFELKSALAALMDTEPMSTENSTEFNAYNEYVEKCKKTVKESFNEERIDACGLDYDKIRFDLLDC